MTCGEPICRAFQPKKSVRGTLISELSADNSLVGSAVLSKADSLRQVYSIRRQRPRTAFIIIAVGRDTTPARLSGADPTRAANAVARQGEHVGEDQGYCR